LTAETQQILVHAQCQIELAADRIIDRLAPRDMKELRRRTQSFPQFSCADIGVAGFRRGEALDRLQHCTQGTVEFELLALTRGIVRQQGKLVQRLLKLRGRLGHCRTCDSSLSSLMPIEDRSLD